MGEQIRRDPHVDGATDPHDQVVAVALHDLAFLNEQVAAARMELANLRNDLAQLRHEVRGTRSGQLLEANQNLVLAALTAQETGANTDEAHRRQIQFLATVAHELRNPLTPIRTAAELITRAQTDESLLPRLQLIIKRQVAHMTRLVDDLLDGSRISTGKFRLERAMVQISDVLDVSIEACLPAIDARFQHFNVQLAPAALYVNGDPARLAQVFNNLLDNASKYTQEGGEIAVTVAAMSDVLTVTVADTGIGITAAALPKIFDLFVQDERALTVHNRGLGIGLAVVRELVEAHDGTVVATSAGVNLGSQFVVTLPLVQQSASA